MSAIRPCVSGTGHVPVSSTRLRTSASVMKELQRECLQYRNIHPSAPEALECFHLFTYIFQLFAMELVDNTVTGCRDVSAEGSVKLLQSRLLNECVHLLSVGFVSAVLSLHHNDLLIVNPLAPSAGGFEIYSKPSSPCRHPFPSVISPLPSLRNLPACVRHQRRARQPHFFPTSTHTPPTIGMLIMSVKRSDKIFDLPCHFVQPLRVRWFFAPSCTGSWCSSLLTSTLRFFCSPDP